eukprot:CAMPEP_0119534460 /NCGR_PEP_ID=MMETSP1344-20130328/47680_1 /TAXON_ID=236787 /ORGANISM="Florenciella parvula, Strain CCMP2471" /LENGTH=88 /DNA_ID=CAMNT_0007575721 /DNA_START=31 /DNA_END=294 /DNA_ORIENTATION=+
MPVTKRGGAWKGRSDPPARASGQHRATRLTFASSAPASSASAPAPSSRLRRCRRSRMTPSTRRLLHRRTDAVAVEPATEHAVRECTVS